MFDWANGMIEDGIDFLQLFVLALCIVVVIMVMYRSRALVPVLGALLLAGIVIFGTSDSGLTWLSDIITEETSGDASGPVDYLVPAPEVFLANLGPAPGVLLGNLGPAQAVLLDTIAEPPLAGLTVIDLAVDHFAAAA